MSQYKVYRFPSGDDIKIISADSRREAGEKYTGCPIFLSSCVGRHLDKGWDCLTFSTYGQKTLYEIKVEPIHPPEDLAISGNNHSGLHNGRNS